MTNLVTLSCQRCGARLTPTRNPSVMRCEHCGQDYLYVNSSPAGGGYASCPLCGRNDRAEKVSAIAGQIQHLNGSTVQHNSYQDNKGNWINVTTHVPITGTQMTTLAQQTARPPEPQPPSTTSIRLAQSFIAFCIMGFGFGVFASINLANTPSYSSNPDTSGVMVCTGICGLLAVLFWFYLQRQNRVYKEKMNQHANVLARWKRACAVWDQLYYCARDDVVFIPGTRLSAPAGQTQSFLYRI